MSKLRKILGKFVVTPEHVLKAVKSPDDIARMTPDEMQMYKEALDQVFGPKEQRMKALGYNPDKPFTEIKTAEKYKYTTNPELVKQLEASGQKGETIFVKDFSPDNVMRLGKQSDIERAKELASIKDRNLIGGKLMDDIVEQASVVDSKPVFNEATSSYDIPKGIIVRDKDAAFDPRFASSFNKFAGAAAIPSVNTDLSPLPYLQSALSKYNEIKKDLADYLANELDMTKDKSTKKDLSEAIEMVADPLNLASPGIGLSLEALNELLSNKPKRP